VPQQNGVVKQKNRTLVEMARTMHNEPKTPRHFWADAISTVCYISNRILLCLNLNLTSCFGHKPSVPFGCKCFILKRGNLDKFDSRSWMCCSCSLFELFVVPSLISVDLS
jgi:hypothetical protein